MDAPRESRVYHEHRERQRRLIMTTAKALFIQRGIDRVGMADIASASGLTRSTIYNYYPTKDEIAWAVFQELFEQTCGRWRLCGDGYTRIAQLLSFLGDELIERPDDVCFLAQFDHRYASAWSPERMIALERQILPGGMDGLVGLVREGIADGSLRPDLDPELTMQAILNAVVALQRRLAYLRGRIEAEYGQRADAMFHEACRIILQGIKAEC